MHYVPDWALQDEVQAVERVTVEEACRQVVPGADPASEELSSPGEEVVLPFPTRWGRMK